MWPLHWMFIIMVATAQAETVPQPPTEPAAAAIQGGAITYKSGLDAYRKGDYKTAIQYFEPFIQKYPAHENYTQAHLLVGMSYFRVKRYKDARENLKYFITAMGNTLEATVARLSLIRTNLALKDFHAAELLLIEVLDRKPEPPTPKEVMAEAYLLRARTQMGMNRDKDSSDTLESTKGDLNRLEASGSPQTIVAGLRGELSWLQLQLKIRQCSPTQQNPKMDEGQARQFFEQRGTCLLESVLDYRDSLATGDHHWIQAAEDELTQAFQTYSQACVQPPGPRGKRTVTELKHYNSELVFMIKSICRDKFTKALGMVDSWQKDQAPTQKQSLETVSHSIQKMRDALS